MRRLRRGHGGRHVLVFLLALLLAAGPVGVGSPLSRANRQGVGPAVAEAGAMGPAPTFADHSTLTILRGGGDYSAQATAPVVAAVDGQDVAVGDRLISQSDADFLLTFFDGSTFTLTPGTDVVVERLDGDATSRQFSLHLLVGTIWARVARVADPASFFQVRATNAVAVVRGSQIGARVLPDGTFQCWTREGAMNVQTGAGQAASLAAGETVVVQPDGQIAVRRLFAPTRTVLRFALNDSVWPVVVHPHGGANGIVAPGIVVSQTFGALVTPPDSSGATASGTPYTIEVPVEGDGTYTLVLEARDQAASQYAGLVTGLVAPFYADNVDADARLITGAELAGPIGPGERLGISIAVHTDHSGAADAALTSITIGAPHPVPGPLGPAKVLVSPLEL